MEKIPANDKLLHKLQVYNERFSEITLEQLLGQLCFSGSYEIFSEIASLFLSKEEVTQELADSVEDFKQLQFVCFDRINSSLTISRIGQSNRINFLVAFLYFYYFDSKYGGVADWDKPKYEKALRAYLKLSENKSLHPCDRETIQDFNNRHLKQMLTDLNIRASA